VTRFPPADRREPITGRPEGGYIATGQCGAPHLVGAGWAWWRCPSCTRLESTQRISSPQRRMLRIFYPGRCL
jgi:hypothetical protein